MSAFLLKQYASRCPYCGSFFDGSLMKTWDHVLPLSRGGANRLDNKVICCHPCNRLKADSTPEEFRDRLGSVLQYARSHPHDFRHKRLYKAYRNHTIRQLSGIYICLAKLLSPEEVVICNPMRR